MSTINPSSTYGSIVATAIILFVASLTAPPTQAEAPTRFDDNAQVTADMFGCIYDFPKVRNTFLFHPEPEKPKEAIHIFLNAFLIRSIQLVLVMQLVPFEAMVKHPSEKYPDSNGWEFLALTVTAESTTITSQADHALNFEGREYLSCHAAAIEYDFVCEKNHGCAPLSIGDEQIAALQVADPRCTQR